MRRGTEVLPTNWVDSECTQRRAYIYFRWRLSGHCLPPALMLDCSTCAGF